MEISTNAYDPITTALTGTLSFVILLADHCLPCDS